MILILYLFIPVKNNLNLDLTCSRKMVVAYEDPSEPRDAHNDGKHYHHFASSLTHTYIYITISISNYNNFFDCQASAVQKCTSQHFQTPLLTILAMTYFKYNARACSRY